MFLIFVFYKERVGTPCSSIPSEKVLTSVAYTLFQHRISGFYPKLSKRMENCWNVTMLLHNIRKNRAICRSNYWWNKLHSELTQRCTVKSTDRAHGRNVEKSWKYQLLATYFNIRIHPESFTKKISTLSHPELLLVTKITSVRLTLRWLMSYIYVAPILDVSRSHTTTQHSR